MSSSPQQLVQGFQRFRQRHFDQHDSLYLQLVKQGQTPKILVVACCDSRVDPALVLDCAPGDLFVIRNVGNLVPPVESRAGHHGTSAAIEYALRILGVEHIIVLGHAHCAGIHTLLSEGGLSQADSYLGDWMSLAESARASVIAEMPRAALAEQLQACEQRAILVSLDNLMTFPWVRERVASGKLTLHAWYFDIEHGELLGFDKNMNKFNSL